MRNKEKADEDMARAITLATQVIKNEPRNPRLRARRAVMSYDNEQYDEAIFDCTKAIQFDPKSVDACKYRGKAVVSTLWQIPGEETVQLMNAFFANLSLGQNKAEALRNAQLSLLKGHRASQSAAYSYYWAAFTLTGE
jgi:tetratricopeptide (TPR) repeat protein